MIDDVYQIEILRNIPQIKHAISTKAFGSIKKDDGTIHHANLFKFAKSQNFASMPICMNQVHGTSVSIIENNREIILPKTDGMVTNKKGLPLTILTADCLPILFYDSQKKVVGVAHAGRKGLLHGIIHEIVSVLKTSFNSEPKDIIVDVGPSIEKTCYEVDESIITEFGNAFPTFSNMFEQKENKYLLDLRAVAMQSLQKEGILEKNIQISSVCTKCDERFYSYRRGDTNGRFASIISLV
jgi:YfiH family protein